MIENKFLLDASFVVAWLNVSDLEIPDEILEKIIKADLFSATVSRYEVGNAVLKYKKYINKKINTAFLFDQVDSLEIKYLNIKNQNSVLNIAEKYNLSFYDASYFALMLENSDLNYFLTFDRDFSKINSKKIKVLS